MSIGAYDGSRPDVEPYLERWGLERDGEAFATPNSVLAPVRHHGQPAMLKIATVTEEALGNRLMVWWDGRDVGGFFARSAVIANELLANQREIVVLHGDIHHGNALDFGGGGGGGGGWLAIDPKHIIGDRAFDFTNILCNPNGVVATRPGRLARQVAVIADAAALDRERLLRWTVAGCALSSAWLERDNRPPGHALEVGKCAERLLDGR